MESIETYKAQAKTLKEFLAAGGINIKHTHALEAVARMHGEKDFHTLSHEAGKVVLGEDVSKAAALLMEAGIGLHIPGTYEIQSPEDAAAFAADSLGYYRMLEKIEAEEEIKRIQREAQNAGTSYEKYLYFLQYANPGRYDRLQRLLNKDQDYSGELDEKCIHVKKNGSRCKNFYFFFGKFEDFIPGIHDHCPTHRTKEWKRSHTTHPRSGSSRATRKASSPFPDAGKKESRIE